MFKLLQYYSRYRGMRSQITAMPIWAKWLLFLVAVPGIAALLLCLVAFGVSLLALLLPTGIVYRLLQWVGVIRVQPAGASAGGWDGVDDEFIPAPHGSDEVEAEVVEATNGPVPERAEPPRTRRAIEVKILDSE